MFCATQVALGPVTALEAAPALRELFTKLTLTQLLQLAKLLRLVEVMSFTETALRPLFDRAAEAAGGAIITDPSALHEAFEALHTEPTYRDSHRLLVEVLTHHLRRRPNQLDAINKLPLFPTELLIWDPSLVPTEAYRGDFALALPKLNVQFLTVRDYLMRNFHLYRLESAYEVRQDLEDAIWRMKPARAYDMAARASAAAAAPAVVPVPASMTKLDTVFTGTWKMAAPIDQFSIVYIREPGVGQETPSEVRAEITISLKRLQPEHRAEWSAIRQFDVLFLIAVQAPAQRFDGRPADLKSIAEFPEKFGVLGVRGCEVVEVLDEEGTSISEQNGGIEEAGSLRPPPVHTRPW